MIVDLFNWIYLIVLVPVSYGTYYFVTMKIYSIELVYNEVYFIIMDKQFLQSLI